MHHILRAGLVCLLLPIGCGRASAPSQSGDAIATEAAPIDLAFLNVFLRPGLIGAWDHKEERFVPMPEALAPFDVIGLAEVFDDGRRERLKAALADSHPFQIDPPESSDAMRQDSGIMLFSRFPLHNVDEVLFGAARGADAFAEKGALVATVAAPGGSFDVLVTHLQSGTPNGDIREAQLQDVARLVAGRGFPLFLIGDFNVIGDTSTEYPTLLETLGEPVDTFRRRHRSPSDSPGYTVDGTRNPLVGHGGRERIDYILCRDCEGLDFLSVDVAPFPHPAPAGDVRYLSDHFGMASRFTVALP